jgi:predicted deacylase
MSSELFRHDSERVPIGILPHGNEINITVHRYESGPGDTVYIQAGQHGIELNGPVALKRLHHALIRSEGSGTVVIVPVVNPIAFDNREYSTPPNYDARNGNINRVWPGNENGSYVERMVNELWPIVTQADYAIDLHTGSPEMLPHVRICQNTTPQCRLARPFGSEYRLIGEGPGNQENNSKKTTFRLAAEGVNIPALTVELGNSGSVGIEAVRRGRNGLMRILQSLGIVTGLPDGLTLPEPSSQRVIYDDVPPVRTPASGIFEPTSELGVGQVVEADTKLGHVFNPATFNQEATITGGDSGVLYSRLDGGIVFSGERIASIATEQSPGGQIK